jgi:hypothetical protein
MSSAKLCATVGTPSTFIAAGGMSVAGGCANAIGGSAAHKAPSITVERKFSRIQFNA